MLQILPILEILGAEFLTQFNAFFMLEEFLVFQLSISIIATLSTLTSSLASLFLQLFLLFSSFLSSLPFPIFIYTYVHICSLRKLVGYLYSTSILKSSYIYLCVEHVAHTVISYCNARRKLEMFLEFNCLLKCIKNFQHSIAIHFTCMCTYTYIY